METSESRNARCARRSAHSTHRSARSRTPSRSRNRAANSPSCSLPWGSAVLERPSCASKSRAAGAHSPGRGSWALIRQHPSRCRIACCRQKPTNPQPLTPSDAHTADARGSSCTDTGCPRSASYMAFVASHYLAPIAAIQQRIRTKKATQLDSENFYIRSSAAPIGAAIYATRVPRPASPESSQKRPRKAAGAI